MYQQCSTTVKPFQIRLCTLPKKSFNLSVISNHIIKYNESSNKSKLIPKKFKNAKAKFISTERCAQKITHITLHKSNEKKNSDENFHSARVQFRNFSFQQIFGIIAKFLGTYVWVRCVECIAHKWK